jgi:hypothetical protein
MKPRSIPEVGYKKVTTLHLDEFFPGRYKRRTWGQKSIKNERPFNITCDLLKKKTDA